MARRGAAKIFTIYHVLDAKGVFDSNPANAQAVNEDGISIYKGPVPFPKMVYHPKGERVLVVHGTAMVSRDGEPLRDKDGEIRRTGDVWGIVNKIVQSEEEYRIAQAEGWHDSEAQAMRVNTTLARQAPPKTLVEQQAEEIARLRAELAEKTTPMRKAG